MREFRNELGFTMVEMIIVIAIIGIIGAVLVPIFSVTTEKVKISTDINSIKAVQKQIECYYAEYGKLPGTTPQTILNELVLQDSIDNAYVSNGNLIVKTPGAQMIFDATQSKVKLQVNIIQYNLFLGQTEQLTWLTH